MMLKLRDAKKPALDHTASNCENHHSLLNFSLSLYSYLHSLPSLI